MKEIAQDARHSMAARNSTHREIAAWSPILIEKYYFLLVTLGSDVAGKVTKQIGMIFLDVPIVLAYSVGAWLWRY